MGPANNGRRLTDIIPDVVTQFATLVRKEVELAKTEMSERTTAAVLGLAFVVAGAILLIPAFLVLLFAAVAALIWLGLAAPLAALIIGVVFLLVGVALLFIGIGRLKPKTLVPHKTVRQVRQDVSAIKGQ